MAKRVKGSPEWIRDIALPEHKRYIEERAKAMLTAAAAQFGFRYVEDAERRFRGNGAKWFYAQIIEEWAVDIYFRVGAYLQSANSIPEDNGEAFLASLPAFDPNRVPAQVTMYQAHMALEADSTLNAGETAYDDDKLAQIDAFLLNSANFPGVREQRRAQIAWQVSGAIRRDAKLTADIGAVLGYDSAALDNLFRTAVQIRPQGSGNA